MSLRGADALAERRFCLGDDGGYARREYFSGSCPFRVEIFREAQGL
jgi:hypothetical protein